MRIALIAFGSLLNDHKGLKIDKWQADGCELPVEFIRISRDLRLTLTICEKNGQENLTYWTLFKNKTLDSAIKDLVKREKIKPEFINKSIAVLDLKNGKINEGAEKYSKELLFRIANWGTKRKIDYILFSSLSPRFKDATAIKFTPENALMFIQNLPVPNQKLAINYIKSIPRIETPFKTLFNKYH